MKIKLKDAPNFMVEGIPLNTRFNPTTNGYLHVGHLYLVLLNAAYATESGGKFQVRFDDNMAVWVARLGERGLDRYAEAARRDIEWCGVQVDEWMSQRALEGEAPSTPSSTTEPVVRPSEGTRPSTRTVAPKAGVAESFDVMWRSFTYYDEF